MGLSHASNASRYLGRSGPSAVSLLHALGPLTHPRTFSVRSPTVAVDSAPFRSIPSHRSTGPFTMNRTELEHIHAKLPGLVDQFTAGTLPRREFLRTSTLLGLSAAAAYGIVGGVDPVAAQEREGTMGGELRVGMAVMEITDPHTFD